MKRCNAYLGCLKKYPELLAWHKKLSGSWHKEEPDYQGFRKLLHDLMARKQLTLSDPMDWSRSTLTGRKNFQKNPDDFNNDCSD